MAEQNSLESEATFALEDEDHTLANALRFMLNKNPHVVFCGYSIPHPTETVVNLRIQTSGEMSAAQALREACHNVKAVCAHMKATFISAMEEEQQQQRDGRPWRSDLVKNRPFSNFWSLFFKTERRLNTSAHGLKAWELITSRTMTFPVWAKVLSAFH